MAMSHYLQGHDPVVQHQIHQPLRAIAPKPMKPSSSLGAPESIQNVSTGKTPQISASVPQENAKEIVQYKPEDPLTSRKTLISTWVLC